MKKEERRQQIIDRAIEVFIENGYKGATTAKIAQIAGISEVTLFRYFSSKQEIFLAGIKPIFVESLQTTLNLSNDYSDQEKIRYLLNERLTFMSNNHRLVKMILQENYFLESIGSENLFMTMLEFFRTFIKRLSMDPPKEQLILRLIMGSILSFLYLPQENLSEIETYVDNLTEIIVKIL